MSTRSQLEFRHSQKGEAVARIYHHWDGYPEGRLPDLKAMWSMALTAYEEPGYAYRKGEPDIADLAAFYVLANKQGAGNVYLQHQIAADIEFFYVVWPDGNKLMVDVQQPKPGTFMDFDPERTKSLFVGTLAEAAEYFATES